MRLVVTENKHWHARMLCLVLEDPSLQSGVKKNGAVNRGEIEAAVLPYVSSAVLRSRGNSTRE